MIWEIIPIATWETLYMTLFSSLFAILIGAAIGLVLYSTKPGGIAQNGVIYHVLDTIVNVMRSIPYIILMILMIPITRVLIGTSIGSTAMLFSLSSAAAPFFARLVETSLSEVDNGVLEAARAMGATNSQIIFRVLVPEAMPSLVAGITTTIINLLAYTAMAGALGGGGLGAAAVRYGYYRYELGILLLTVIIIVLLVQIIQFAGTTIARKINKK